MSYCLKEYIYKGVVKQHFFLDMITTKNNSQKQRTIGKEFSFFGLGIGSGFKINKLTFSSTNRLAYQSNGIDDIIPST